MKYSEQQENDQQTNNNSNDVSISSIQILENGSDPLYVAINNQGETRVMTTDGLMRCRFKTDLYERKHDKWSISINQTNANMIAYTNDDKCQGKISEGGIIAVRVVLAIFVAAMIVIGVVICYKVIKQPKSTSTRQNY